MLDLSRDVMELCQEHGLGPEWIERAACAEDLLDRALEECERLSGSHGRLSEASLLELRGLVHLALLARELQRGPSTGPAVGTGQSREPEGRERMRRLLDELAALCHRINNPLTSLMGRTQMLRHKVGAEPDAPVHREMQVIEESAKRIAGLVQELAQLAVQGRVEILDGETPR